MICVGGVDYMKQKRLNNVFWQENERNWWRYRRRFQIFRENLGYFDWLLGFLEPGWDKDCCVDIQLLFWNLSNVLRSILSRICRHLLHFFQHLKKLVNFSSFGLNRSGWVQLVNFSLILLIGEFTFVDMAIYMIRRTDKFESTWPLHTVSWHGVRSSDSDELLNISFCIL